MKKSSLAIVGLAVVVIAVVVFSSPKDNVQDSDYAYHINLSESKYGEDGIYRDSFDIEIGELHYFRFVANGDSPQTLRILIGGEFTFFSGDFVLAGTLVETDVSQYYTWKYDWLRDATCDACRSGDTLNPYMQYFESGHYCDTLLECPWWETGGKENVDIVIDPHGNTKGTVSVYIIQEEDCN